MHIDTLCTYAFAALVAAIGLILALYGAEELRPYAEPQHYCDPAAADDRACVYGTDD